MNMVKHFQILFILFLFFSVDLYSQTAPRVIVINEIDQTNRQVELLNTGSTTVDITGWWLCNRPNLPGSTRYDQIDVDPTITLISGSLMMAPGAFTVLSWDHMVNTGGEELGLYLTNTFGNSDQLEDYVIYNQIDTPNRLSVAVAAGVWASTSDFVPPLVTSTNSIALNPGTYAGGTDTDLSDWVEMPNTIGGPNVVNQPGCDFVQLDVNGTIPDGVTNDAEIIVSDGLVPGTGTVSFFAQDEILLNSDFEVQLGGVFEADIQTCP